MLHIEDAEHAESFPEAPHLVVSKLVCSLVGSTETVTLLPGTLAGLAYGVNQASESFACNYGLNPDYREPLFQGKLKVSGFGPDGEVRLVELEGSKFFVGTLFLPQVNSTEEKPHPLIVEFIRTADV